jgi:hypothetical protein
MCSQKANMMSNATTWYVVADGGKARILTLDDDKMRTLESFDNSGHGDISEDPSAGTSQLKAPRSDPHGQGAFCQADRGQA